MYGFLILGACICTFLLGRLSVYFEQHYNALREEENQKREEDATSGGNR